MLRLELAMRSNISLFICGMMPGRSEEPVIEKDLPAPVWPYAKIVPFHPPNAFSSSGAPRFW